MDCPNCGDSLHWDEYYWLCSLCHFEYEDDKDLRTPTEKSPVINALLSELAGKDRLATMSRGGCMTCDRADEITAEDFRDALSVREYRISGMCQECQNQIFDAPED